MNKFIVRVQPLFVCLRQPLVLAAWAVTLLFLIVVIKRLLPLGVPGEGQWVWAYRDTVAPVFTFGLPLLVFMGVIAVWAYVWEQSEKKALRGAFVALIFFVVGACALRASIQKINTNPPEIPEAFYVGWTIVSRVSTTYFADALTVGSVPEFLRTFPERMRQSDWHGKTHPPGTILFFYLVDRWLHQSPNVAGALMRWMGWQAWEEVSAGRELVQGRTGVRLDDTSLVAAAAAGYLLPMLGCWGLMPLFQLTRRLFDDRTAWALALLWLVVPSLDLFFPVVDQIYLTLAIVVLWLLGEGLARPCGRFTAAAGIALSFGLFMTFSFLALLAVCVLWIGLATLRQRDVMLRRLAVFAVGLLLPMVVLYLLFGLNMLTVLQIALTAHGGVTERRIRSVWMVVNLMDFFMLLGLPITLFFMVSFFHHVKKFRAASANQRSVADALLLAYVITLLLLNVSGVVRGEVGRIWMFLTPVPLVWAAHAIADDEQRGGLRVGILSSAALLQTLVLQREVWFVRPW
jgi:hypothetical protein